MKTDCVHSNVCQMWINQLHDTGGCYYIQCRNCEHYLERAVLVRNLTGYPRILKNFLEGV